MKSLIVLLLLSVSPAFAVQVKVAEAPTNNLALTVQAIETAQTYLLVNIYEFSSPEIAEALINRIKAGVHVELLEEGQPVGGISKAARAVQERIAKAMEQYGDDNHLFVMTSKPSGEDKVKRRFRFDHAKYIVADGKTLLVGSENYSPTGHASPGAKGNRGWEVLVRDAELAAHFKTVFRSDTDLSHGDVMDVMALSAVASKLFPSELTAFDDLKEIARGLPIFDVESVKPILSPESSREGLIAMLDNARTSIDIEQMTFDSTWGSDDSDSPLLESVIAAARRGVKVRVLLNDSTVFDRPGSKPAKPKNLITVNVLNQLALKERLKLAARVANLDAMGVTYIHNKGALIDGELTLVSSINWNQNAVENNREAAVLIESPEVFSHYETLFESDWRASANLN